jgi:asparagine synthase (glutamine-hydrolysing)
MCGLSGVFSLDPSRVEGRRVELERMLDTIVSRGPDASGVWLDPERGIALGHRRLSIIDLSPAGAQPMQSACGRYVIAFNGEIYNHAEIRSGVESSGPIQWRGHSDTESLLAGFSTWGIAETVRRSIGMFAFAVWDRKDRKLTLGRDRLGEKPLYFGWQGRGGDRVFLFGSELKALKAHPAFDGGIDRDALCLLMRHNYIPAPRSIYQGISKLSPGCLLELSQGLTQPKTIQYWSPETAIHPPGVRSHVGRDATESVDELERLLKSAVKQQMVADVPLGAFLSGGIDSSTVVALMQAQSDRPVRTFSIGFNEEGYNEAVHAKAVAAHLGTDHTELYVTAQQALDVIPKLPSLYCEPFADSSQIPTFLVSQMARRHVTVSLSGDAGDELFCGYTRYPMAARAWSRLGMVPAPARRAIARSLTSFHPDVINAAVSPFRGLLPKRLRAANLGDRAHKIAGVIATPTFQSFYQRMVSAWTDPESVVLGGSEPETCLSRPGSVPAGLSHYQQMQLWDLLTYLPDDILAKVDRAAMGVSLETRVPFLDHRVVEYALRLPEHLKQRNGVGKWILRQVLYRHVPRELIERPKMGFGVPIDVWLRGPLRDWAESLLEESRLKREGFFNASIVRQRWSEHLSGQRNWHYHLWIVLMFQAWLDEWN